MVAITSQRALWTWLMISLTGRTTVAFVLYTPTTSYNADLDDGYYAIDGTGPWQMHMSDYNLSQLVIRWHNGDQDANPLNGLGGGISWALHPHFCDDLLRQFRSERLLFGSISMIDCSELRAAVDVGFRTWSANHRGISFHDVTSSCTDVSTFTDEGTRCAAAEVMIQTHDLTLNEGEENIAYVSFNMQDATLAPRMTNGYRIEGRTNLADGGMNGVGLLSATISINPKHCWYLDPTFCSFIHNFVDKNGLEAFVRVSMVSLISLAGLLFVWLLCRANAIAKHESSCLLCIRRPRRASFDQPSNSLGRIDEKIDEAALEQPKSSCFRSTHSRHPSIHWVRVVGHEVGRTVIHLPLTPTLLLTFMACFLPVFFVDVFLPCYECHDFEATIAHEAGHLLGFHHPDSFPQRNLKRSSEYSLQDGCDDPLLRGFEIEPFRGGVDTLMMSTAAHRPRTCLTQDDYDGLHALYPLCPQMVNLAPSCVKMARYTGVVRLIMAVAIPFMAATLVFLITQCIARYVQRQRVRRLEETVQRQSMQQTWLRASLTAASQARRRAEEQITKLTRPSFRPSFRPSLARLTHKKTPMQTTTPRKLGGLFSWRKQNATENASHSGLRNSGQRSTDNPSPLDILEQHLNETRNRKPVDPFEQQQRKALAHNISGRGSKDNEFTSEQTPPATHNVAPEEERNGTHRSVIGCIVRQFSRSQASPSSKASRKRSPIKPPINSSMSLRAQATEDLSNATANNINHNHLQPLSGLTLSDGRSSTKSTKSMDSLRSSAGSAILNRSRGTRDTLVLGDEEDNV